MPMAPAQSALAMSVSKGKTHGGCHAVPAGNNRWVAEL